MKWNNPVLISYSPSLENCNLMVKKNDWNEFCYNDLNLDAFGIWRHVNLPEGMVWKQDGGQKWAWTWTQEPSCCRSGQSPHFFFLNIIFFTVMQSWKYIVDSNNWKGFSDPGYGIAKSLSVCEASGAYLKLTFIPAQPKNLAIHSPSFSSEK